MRTSLKTLSLALITALTLSSCAKKLDNNVYTEGDTAGIVYEGVIISARPVTVKASDKLGAGGSGLGTIGGGVAGGIGGSQIGKGKGSAVGAVGGVVAGAILGNLIEDRLNTQQGMEYIVRLSDDSVSDMNDNQSSRNVRLGGDSVSDKVRNSTKLSMKSKTLSIVQGTDQIMNPGQKVYVIYNDDRPRVVPAF